MAPRARQSRASSVPSSPTTTPTPTPIKPSSSSSAAPAAAKHPRATEVAQRASLLQPRVAVALNVPRPWHPWLFALRLSSILPAVWWGTPSALRLLLRVLEILVERNHGGVVDAGDPFVPLTESALAAIWCFASGYLSFFFTDCLMSRWLINYTPQATMVRLLTINAINAYVTSILLSLAGGFHDPRLLLPGWIGIATVHFPYRDGGQDSEGKRANQENFSLQTLTVCYHITHQKINIRKETSTSVNVFSIASYITMITLLAYIYVSESAYPAIPVLVRTQHIWDETRRRASQIRDYLEQHKEF
ncbi:hypothetical protein ACO1O0_005624 [Amphichorda felina]